MNITKKLFELADEKYADFQAKLTPTIGRARFLGVRVPEARKLAKVLYQSGEDIEFLSILPHTFFDENMLHGLILSEYQDYDTCIAHLDRFLPYVDNWAVCDVMSPKSFRKNKDKLLGKIEVWSGSNEVYTARFGLKMLMTHFLDEDFSPAFLEIPVKVKLEDYYAKMMIAWFFATALAKQWNDVVPYLEKGVLEPWTHNKIIQKARESHRITEGQKVYLKTLKKKGDLCVISAASRCQ